jgi:protein-S-isoprenylcysteine O-methyltransferase Ste14
MSATVSQPCFAQTQDGATADGRYQSQPTVLVARAEQAPLVHLSAVLAWGCFATGIVTAQLINPTVAHDLSSGGVGAMVLATAFAAFMLLISLIQRHMGTALTASQTLTPPKLCTSGIFKYSRNPIYLAFLIPLAAICIYSVVAGALAIAAYVATMTVFVIRGEEKGLGVMFGADYQTYLATTPRWLGI